LRRRHLLAISGASAAIGFMLATAMQHNWNVAVPQIAAVTSVDAPAVMRSDSPPSRAASADAAAWMREFPDAPHADTAIYRDPADHHAAIEQRHHMDDDAAPQLAAATSADGPAGMQSDSAASADEPAWIRDSPDAPHSDTSAYRDPADHHAAIEQRDHMDEGFDSMGFPIVVLPPGRTVRACWGIVAPGRIAGDFAAALVGLGGRLCAVGAGYLPHPAERAAEFAKTFGANRSYGSYAALAADEEVTMVYIATVNHKHKDLTALFLNAGKHVLLEKPATVCAADFDALVALAKRKRLLFVTNYWTRFFPAVKWARAAIERGAIGRVVHMTGDMAFQAVRQVKHKVQTTGF